MKTELFEVIPGFFLAFLSSLSLSSLQIQQKAQKNPGITANNSVFIHTQYRTVVGIRILQNEQHLQINSLQPTALGVLHFRFTSSRDSEFVCHERVCSLRYEVDSGGRL